METAEKPKRKKRVSGTARQKVALAKLVETRGNVSRAMIEAGYSPATAKNPKNLTDSRAFQELVEQYLPDSLLLEKHGLIINSPRVRRTFMKGAMIEEVEETDPAQVRGLDMAYKLKGKYQSEGPGTQVLIVQVSANSSTRYGSNEGTSD